MNKVLVSSCLVGLSVRYNGTNKPTDAAIIERWRIERRLVHMCPEVSAGFPTPRPPAEIQKAGGAEVLAGSARVLENNGRDVTNQYLDGANNALKMARVNGVVIALLTDGSPSCGSTFIYTGDFSGRAKAGIGVTAALLESHGIRVFPESQIEEAEKFLRDLENQTTA